jgi:hypothetical protein
MYDSTLPSTSALDGVGGQCHAPAALPPGNTRYPLYRRVGGPQNRCGRVRKISPPTGFDPQTVHPVTSLYTDCAIPAPSPNIIVAIKLRDRWAARVELIFLSIYLRSYDSCRRLPEPKHHSFLFNH